MGVRCETGSSGRDNMQVSTTTNIMFRYLSDK